MSQGSKEELKQLLSDMNWTVDELEKEIAKSTKLINKLRKLSARMEDLLAKKG